MILLLLACESGPFMDSDYDPVGDLDTFNDADCIDVCTVHLVEFGRGTVEDAEEACAKAAPEVTVYSAEDGLEAAQWCAAWGGAIAGARGTL